MGFLKIKLGIFRRPEVAPAPFGSNAVGDITALSQMLFCKNASLIYQVEWFYGVSKEQKLGSLRFFKKLLWI